MHCICLVITILIRSLTQLYKVSRGGASIRRMRSATLLDINVSAHESFIRPQLESDL